MSHLIVRRIAPIVLFVGVIGSLSACGSSGEPLSADTTTPASTSSVVDTLAPPEVVNEKSVVVEATDNDFGPKHLQITAGTKVTFANKGRNQHDVIPSEPKDGDFTIVQEDFEPGIEVTRAFTKPGVYPYFCSLHATATAGSMRGVITVTAAKP